MLQSMGLQRVRHDLAEQQQYLTHAQVCILFAVIILVDSAFLVFCLLLLLNKYFSILFHNLSYFK